MDIFDEEILRFWKCLQDNNVKYILVGDYASNFHGYKGFTSLMGIWIDDTCLNRKNLRAPFKECDIGDYPMVETMEFVPGWTEFCLNNGLVLDVLVDMKGLENYSFNECLEMASIADIEDVKVPFLHLNQLLANKKAVNRPKDQLDVINLERIKKLRDQ